MADQKEFQNAECFITTLRPSLVDNPSSDQYWLHD